VNRRNSKKVERPVFESIRKPTAPSSQRFGGDRPEERIHPTQRKVKHKKKPEREDLDADV
jgi:hypothetical protein